MGIWGLETNYGTYTGGFSVVQALATLGWTSHRPGYFRSELVSALTILDSGAVTPQGMTGSYAGAMGQPQFMPSVYLKLAISFTGTGRPDIWTSVPDSLASIANYLSTSGWRGDAPWGEAVLLASRVDAAVAYSMPARLIQPDGVGGAAYLVYPNYHAIRRYNPSDFYALSVGLLGDLITA
jgi:membrane-bound lytic murein transglycosylase B